MEQEFSRISAILFVLEPVVSLMAAGVVELSQVSLVKSGRRREIDFSGDRLGDVGAQSQLLQSRASCGKPFRRHREHMITRHGAEIVCDDVIHTGGRFRPATRELGRAGIVSEKFPRLV